METIRRTLDKLETGQARSFRNLTVFPLLQRVDAGADYLTLDEALKAGAVRVTEVNEDGSVPELRLINEGERTWHPAYWAPFVVVGEGGRGR